MVTISSTEPGRLGERTLESVSTTTKAKLTSSRSRTTDEMEHHLAAVDDFTGNLEEAAEFEDYAMIATASDRVNNMDGDDSLPTEEIEQRKAEIYDLFEEWARFVGKDTSGKCLVQLMQVFSKIHGQPTGNSLIESMT